MSVELAPHLEKLGGQVLKDIEVASGEVAGPALLGMDRFPPEHYGIKTLHAMASIIFLSGELRVSLFSRRSSMLLGMGIRRSGSRPDCEGPLIMQLDG